MAVETVPGTPEGELITGLLISQIVMARMLDESGLIPKADYAARLEEWIEGQPEEMQDAVRYVPLRYLIHKLGSPSGRLQ